MRRNGVRRNCASEGDPAVTPCANVGGHNVGPARRHATHWLAFLSEVPVRPVPRTKNRSSVRPGVMESPLLFVLRLLMLAAGTSAMPARKASAVGAQSTAAVLRQQPPIATKDDPLVLVNGTDATADRICLVLHSMDEKARRDLMQQLTRATYASARSHEEEEFAGQIQEQWDAFVGKVKQVARSTWEHLARRMASSLEQLAT
ncbi:hypothetical protein V5799_002174 [Amblyomma americanum]|uniref:Uncharacterized protein n=1 Tax=Amblyomma americanum TaxID=6943 RepID=A0AAQ4CY34_AMBAM